MSYVVGDSSGISLIQTCTPFVLHLVVDDLVLRRSLALAHVVVEFFEMLVYTRIKLRKVHNCLCRRSHCKVFRDCPLV